MASFFITINAAQIATTDKEDWTRQFSYNKVGAYLNVQDAGWTTITTRHEYRTYYQFDISSILKYKIISVKFAQNVVSIEKTNVNPHYSMKIGSSDYLPTRSYQDEKFAAKATVGSATPTTTGQTVLNISNNYISSYKEISGSVSYVTFESTGTTTATILDNGGRGTASNMLTFSNPQLVFEVDYYTPSAPTELTPTGIKNPQQEITLGWKYNPTAPTADDLKNSQIQYRINSGAWNQINVVGPGTDYKFAANAFSDTQKVEWQVRTESTNNGWSDWSAIATINMQLDYPSAPTELSPNATNKRAVLPVECTWKYNPTIVTDPVTKSELKYSVSGGTAITIPINNDTLKYTFAANTFVTGNVISWQVRDYGKDNGWSPWSTAASFSYTVVPADAPTALQPNSTVRQPGLPIECTWAFNPKETEDLVKSELKYSVDGGASTTIPINNGDAKHTFTARTFALGQTVTWQTRTNGSINGWSAWSAVASFKLEPTPPKAPLLVYPPNNQNVIGGNEIALEVQYDSEYDNKATLFDFEYKKETESVYTKKSSATSSILTPVITESVIVTWRARAYGAYGDVGPWSAYFSFYVSGIPKTPAITDISVVSNPVVTWSGTDINNYEIQILQSNNILYSTGLIPYVNNNQFKVPVYLPNGNYSARVRTETSYGYSSEWGEKAFVLNLVPPPKATITAIEKEYFIRLEFTKVADKQELLRSYTDKEDYKIIADVTSVNAFDDYTANSGTLYKYKIRSIKNDTAFSDSDVAYAKINFDNITLADINNPSDFVKLKFGLDNDIKKDESFETQKEFLVLSNREYPVMEVGKNKQSQYSYSNIYCTKEEFEKLKTIENKTCILRDKDSDSFKCGIQNLQKSKQTYALDGYAISFVARRLNN